MELFKQIMDLVDANLIYCLPAMILSLWLVDRLFQNRWETAKALNFIRWIILAYTLVTLAFTLIQMLAFPEEGNFMQRASGPYAWAYVFMFSCAFLIPLTLFSKKLASKFGYVLLVAFAMKAGVYLERLVILTTSFQRDYQSQTAEMELMQSLSYSLGAIFLQGILLALLILGLFEGLKRAKGREE